MPVMQTVIFRASQLVCTFSVVQHVYMVRHTVCAADCVNNIICDSDGTNCRCKEGYGSSEENDCCNCAEGNVTHRYYKTNGTCTGKIKLDHRLVHVIDQCVTGLAIQP